MLWQAGKGYMQGRQVSKKGSMTIVCCCWENRGVAYTHTGMVWYRRWGGRIGGVQGMVAGRQVGSVQSGKGSMLAGVQKKAMGVAW